MKRRRRFSGIRRKRGPVSFGKERAQGKRDMDITWITDRIGLGGGIWNADNMAEVARAGITHVIDMQLEFDDTPLAAPHGIEVLWNPTDDDFQPKTPDIFERGVEFGLNALDEPGSRIFIHCAAGVHRAPMMTLALMCSIGWKVGDAMQMIEGRRPVVDFAEVYVSSVERFLESQVSK
jgi:protein-tyrosine phosphatase